MTLPLPQSVPPLPPRARRTIRRISLALAMLGAGLGAAALVVVIARPTPAPPAVPPPVVAPAVPTFSAEEIAAAKAKTCREVKRAIDGLRATFLVAAPGSPDDARGQSAIASARIARLNAATRLPAAVDPATPGDLRDVVMSFASAAGDSLLSSLDRNRDQFLQDTAIMNSKLSEMKGLCA